MATISVPHTANDVLVAFSEALGAAQDSEQQINTLNAVRTALDEHPEYLSAIYSTLLSVTARSGAVLLRWIADVVELVIARLAIISNALSVEQRTHMTIQSIDAILLFLDSPDFEIHKLGLQCFASAYPVLLRHACMSPSDSRSWEKTCRAKGITFNAWRNGSIGSRIAAMKVVQKIIQSQSRATADPRLQNRGDMNLSMCPSMHPFVSARQLEEEGNKLLEESTSLLFAANIPDIISALVNAFTILVKARPTLGNRIMAALTSWTPNAISSLSAVQIKSVEKTVRLALYYLFRSGSANAFVSQINDFMQRQDARMRLAHDAEVKKKDDEASLKRARISDDPSGGPDFLHAKRRRLDDGTSASPTPPPGVLSSADRQHLQSQLGTLRQTFDVAAAVAVPAGIKSYDVTQIPAQTVMELVIANLLVMTEEVLTAASATAKMSMGAAAEKLLFGDSATVSAKTEAVAFDPLKAELDEDDLEGRARAAAAREKQDQAALAAAEAEAEADSAKNADGTGDTFSGLPGTVLAGDKAGEDKITVGTILSHKAKSKLLHTAIERIVAAGRMAAGAADNTNTTDKHLWLQLIARLATRGLSDLSDETEAVKAEKNNIRKQIFDHIVADLPERLELARLWLNEEWYTQTHHIDNVTAKNPQYEIWLRRVLDSISNSSITKEAGAAFAQFFVDLPELPSSEMQRVEKMCLQTASMKVGFMTLRDLAMLRPPMRSIAMDILLGLATHPEKPIRGTAILTIKRWVPDVQPLGQMGADFALLLLQRLAPTATRQISVSQQPCSAPTEGTPATEPSEHKDKLSSDETSTTAATVKDGVIVSGLEHVRSEAQVAQHVELLFGLVSKAPELLDELFQAYSRMSADVQQILQQLCVPLIRSLGPNHAKIQSIVESYPDGSEDLVFKVLTILTDKGKLPAALAAHIRKLASEKDMSPRFLVPIIAEFDKAEITKHLPRIISTLDGKQAGKDVIRSVLSSIVTTPPQNFGTSSSNAPRARQPDLFTPVELLVLLHLSEKEIGLKQAIEAINICFSMSDTFRPEVLAAFMQQVIDEPSLPTLFLRTVIQAVTTYKSLIPYVSKTLLARLITKKIWTTPQLWQGFIRCTKVIAPQSFDAILQLPKEQMKELVAKQPDLRVELIDHVKKRAGANQQRSAPLLEILQAEL